jgi:alpha-L-arabinofuranosidase
MSEFRRQIAAGTVTAVVIALVLASGVNYLFPIQSTQGGQSSTTTSTYRISTTTTTSTSYSETAGPSTTKATDTVPPGASTTVVTTTASAVASYGTTVTITVTETKVTATVTVGQIETTTTVVTEQLQITDAQVISTNQITLKVVNVGYVKETLTSISVNGELLSSFNGGTSNPSLPITIEPGTSQTLTFDFSSPLQTGTYYITFSTQAG